MKLWEWALPGLAVLPESAVCLMWNEKAGEADDALHPSSRYLTHVKTMQKPRQRTLPFCEDCSRLATQR